MVIDWKGIYARSLEEISTVESYVKNQFNNVQIIYLNKNAPSFQTRHSII
jgi:hypothetical protein